MSTVVPAASVGVLRCVRAKGFRMTEVVLHTKRLELEPIVPSHASRLFEALQAPAIYTYIPEEPPVSLLALSERYTRWSARQNEAGDQVWLNYAIRDRSNASYLGTVQATIVEPGRALLAYLLFPHAWGKGIASEACLALIRALFERFGVNKVAAHVDTRNTASWRLLESLSFERVATIENADVFKGKASDEYVYERRADSISRQVR